MDGDEHLREWAALHMTQPPTGFVGGWLRTMAAVARPLAKAGVSPNAVTVAALVVAAATVPLAMVDGWIGPAGACVALIVSGLLDALDGAVAVQAGRTTKVGFFLDSALDRLSDAALPVALAIAADHPDAGGSPSPPSRPPGGSSTSGPEGRWPRSPPPRSSPRVSGPPA